MKPSDLLLKEPKITPQKLFKDLFPDYVNREKEIYGVIYCFTSPSGKKYIGKSIDWRDRFGRYKGCFCEKQKHFYNALCSYGFYNFDIVILCECSNHEELCKKEIEYIKEYKSLSSENGYNITMGGEGGEISEETKKKISKTLTGQRHSEERKNNIKNTTMRGEAHTSYNHTIYNFYNMKEEYCFTGTSAQLKTKYNLGHGGVSDLVRGVYKNCRDWTCLGEFTTNEDLQLKLDEIKLTGKYYPILYKFYKVSEMKELIISAKDFCQKYDVNSRYFSTIIKQIGTPRELWTRRSVKDWILLEKV